MKKNIFITLFMLGIALFSGCSAGNIASDVDASQTGAFKMSLNWGDGKAVDNGEKVIPQGTQSIEIAITGDGAPIATTVPYGQTQVLITDISMGNKVATVRALNASSGVMAQRKVAFLMQSGQTVDSGAVPLGVAIIGNVGNYSFEPSNMNVPAGTAVKIQNWTTGALSGKQIDLNLIKTNVSFPAAFVNGSGQWNFSEVSYQPYQAGAFSLDQNPAAGIMMNTPAVTNYVFERELTGLNNPLGIDIDRDGNIYIAEHGLNKIYKYNSAGAFVTAFGDSFNSPADVEVGPSGNIYYAEWQGGVVKKFESNGALILGWNPASGRLGGIAVDSQENVYISLADGGYVKKYDSTGQFIQNIGSAGGGEGQWNYPWGIGVDKYDNIYASDFNNNCVQKMTSNGSFVTKFASSIPNADNVEVDLAGNIYISQHWANRVTKLDSNWNYIMDITCGVNAVYGCAVDKVGNLYICDRYNGKIKKLNPVP